MGFLKEEGYKNKIFKFLSFVDIFFLCVCVSERVMKKLTDRQTVQMKNFYTKSLNIYSF